MKVLMLGWEFPPHISGGLGTACHGLTQGLAKHDVEVLFVMPKASGDEDGSFGKVLGANTVDLAAEAHETALTDLAENLLTIEVDSPLRPYQTEESYPATLLADVAPPEERIDEEPFEFTGSYGDNLMEEVSRYAVVVGEIATEHEFDVIHAHDWMTYPAGIRAAQVSGKPLVVHLHASEFDRGGDHRDERIQEIEQLGLSAADRVITVSHYTAGILKTRYGIDPEKITVVHNAVTVKEQAEALGIEKNIEEPIVLFLGRITYQKGPEYFLEAAAKVLQLDPNVKFVVCGSGDMLPRMIERAAELGIARNVHFTGFLKGEEVEKMYAMADIYVMPSVSEPFGISPLEAMALDVPVVVSRQSGVAEILDHALKVDYWDVGEMANKILALIRHPALSGELSEEGREEVRKMRWEMRAELVRDVYAEVTS